MRSPWPPSRPPKRSSKFPNDATPTELYHGARMDMGGPAELSEFVLTDAANVSTLHVSVLRNGVAYSVLAAPQSVAERNRGPFSNCCGLAVWAFRVLNLVQVADAA